MDRLTSNKPVSEMGGYELAHNSCYTKDSKARVRDFENDSDTRKLIIKLLEKYVEIPNEFTCDEDFDEFMLDCLQYGTDSILGLIAVFYQNLWSMAGSREQLKDYEDTGLSPEDVRMSEYALEDAAEELEEFWGMETNLVGEIKDLLKKMEVNHESEKN